MGIRDYEEVARNPTVVGAIAVAHRKPVSAQSDWHPTTIPYYEVPFRLQLGRPHKGQLVEHPITFFLARHGDAKELEFDVKGECVKLGCTVINNDALCEAYWYSNASPRWLRWIVRMYDGWKRRPQ